MHWFVAVWFIASVVVRAQNVTRDEISGSSRNGIACHNDCAGRSWGSDSDCDDGGEGAEYATCPLGSDCQDCGPRVVPGLCLSNCTVYGSDGDWCAPSHGRTALWSMRRAGAIDRCSLDVCGVLWQ